jgi:hypothetical protein
VTQALDLPAAQLDLVISMNLFQRFKELLTT